MKTLELVITEEHRKRAIKAVLEGNKLVINNCLIAQGVLEQFPYMKVSVGCKTVEIDNKIWTIDKVGQSITETSAQSWKGIALPQKVTLTTDAD